MKKIIILIICLVIVASGFFVAFINLEKKQLKADVEEYLLQRGYKNSDITSINTYFGKMPFFSAKVIFNDEEQVEYFYLKDKGQIKQFSTPLVDGSRNYNIIDKKFKHLEK
jgi:hypothetical protein